MISIEKKVNESVVNYGLVNNVLIYNTLSHLDAVKSDISFLGITKTIRPAPDGSFYYNLKSFISALFSSKGFQDNTDIDIELYGFVYSFNAFSLIKGTIDVVTTLSNSTTETFTNSVHFLNAVKQKEDINKRVPFDFSRDAIFPLHPLAEGSNRKMYLDYWAGYPMDLAIHKGTESTTTKFVNNTTLSEYEATTGSTDFVSRYVFSDGREEIGLAEKFNMTEGINNITVSSNGFSFELVVNRMFACNEGVYIKWLNNQGGYSYYFFHKADRFRKTSDLGEIENDYYNVEDTVSPTVFIGKKSNDTMRLVAYCVVPEMQTLFNELVESPAVFLFTGVPFNKNTFKDWISIKMTSNNVKTQNAKQLLNNYEFNFDLSQRNTRTL